MRFKFGMLTAAVGVLGVLVVGVGSALATSSKATVKCTVIDYTLSPGKLKGAYLGAEKCPAPYGNGLQGSTFDETVKSDGTIISKGTFKNYYNTGTEHGAYTLTGKFTSGGKGQFSGPVKITGGTGAFAGAKAAGKLTCVTANDGDTTACVAVVKNTAV